MSIGPKFAVFGKRALSRRAVVSSTQVPEFRRERPDTDPWESARGMESSGTTPQQQFRQRIPQIKTRLTSSRNVQRTKPNPDEGRGLFFSRDTSRSRQGDRQTTNLVPQSASLPVWLTWLIQWQRRSSLVTFLLVSATLAVYGGTVYTQQLWNREYHQLETLRVKQRQLTAASEILKNRLAEEAEQQDNGLVPATPNTNLFLPPAQEQANQLPSSTPTLNGAANPQLVPKRVGY